MKRYKLWATSHNMGTLHCEEHGGGMWVKWNGVKDAIALLKEARYLCAYPDTDMALLDEIDAFLIKAGETELPELE